MEKSARPGVNRLAEGQGHCSWPAPAPSPVCGEPGKGRALVLPASFWPGASLPRATRSTAPGTVLYISWGGSVLGFRLPCCTGPWGLLQEKLPAHSTASVNRKSTSSSDLLFGSEAAQGIPPPLLTALQTPNTIPMTARLLWPPCPSECVLSPSRMGTGGVRTWWGCTCQAGTGRLGEASIKEPLGTKITL